jgi:recombinational DNA repair protein RecR
MLTLSTHLFSLLILVSGVGATMVWLAARSSLIERRDNVKRCAACGRLTSGELCRCAQDRDRG